MAAIRRLLPFVAIGMVAPLLYLGWVAASRRAATSRLERAAQARQSDAALQKPATAGTELRIPFFYANSFNLTEGEQAVICYAVENSGSVRIEPPVEQLKPAYNRCFAVRPRRTTTYTLVAEGDGGRREAASLTVTVRPPPPHIEFIDISSQEIQRGELF